MKPASLIGGAPDRPEYSYIAFLSSISFESSVVKVSGHKYVKFAPPIMDAGYATEQHVSKYGSLIK